MIMKNFTTKTLTFILIGLLAVSHQAKSQDFGEIFKAGPEDAEKYLENYAKPIMLSFNNGLGSGWYNTAKPHKLLGFDITASVNVASIPSKDEIWQFNNSDFKNLQLANGTSANLPTGVGGPTDTQLIVKGNAEIGNIKINGQSDPFRAAEGFDTGDVPIKGVPVPTVQLGVGIIKNTDVKIRFVPKVGSDDVEFNLFGIGVLHDLKQWIPGFKQIPVDISGFIGYTSLKATAQINESGTDTRSGLTYSVDNGSAEFKASSTTVQVVASKKLSILTPYVGIGYNIGGSSFKVNGDFNYTDEFGNKDVISNPFDLSFKGGSSPRMTVGARLKLLILTIHADYSIQKYNTLTVGVGLNIR